MHTAPISLSAQVNSKVVATIGPSSCTVDTLEAMLKAGMSVARYLVLVCPIVCVSCVCACTLMYTPNKSHDLLASWTACHECSIRGSPQKLIHPSMWTGEIYTALHRSLRTAACAPTCAPRIDLTWGSLKYHKRVLRNLQEVRSL